MTKYKLEYIWLDGYSPANLRGKTQVKEFETFPTLEQLPLWGFLLMCASLSVAFLGVAALIDEFEARHR